MVEGIIMTVRKDNLLKRLRVPNPKETKVVCYQCKQYGQSEDSTGVDAKYDTLRLDLVNVPRFLQLLRGFERLFLHQLLNVLFLLCKEQA